MKTLQINTTQNVKINFVLANINQRLLAFFIDNILKIAYIYFIQKYFKFSNLKIMFFYDSFIALKFILLLPVLLYSLYFEILMNGQTPGKSVMGIKIINIEGFKPSKIDHLIRWFMRVVDFNFFVLIFIYLHSLELNNFYLIFIFFLFGKLIGFCSILNTKNNKRLGDIVANTVVIQIKDNAQFSDTILKDIEHAYKPKYLNVIKLSDNDIQIIKDHFEIASENKDYKTLIKLRKKIISVTGIEKQHGSTDIEFINTVLKDYNYYTQNM